MAMKVVTRLDAAWLRLGCAEQLISDGGLVLVLNPAQSGGKKFDAPIFPRKHAQSHVLRTALVVGLICSQLLSISLCTLSCPGIVLSEVLVFSSNTHTLLFVFTYYMMRTMIGSATRREAIIDR